MDHYEPGLIAPSTRTPVARFVTDVVVELGLASSDDVHAAVEAAKTAGVRAEAVLLQHGVLDDERLAHALAERHGLDRLDLERFAPDPDAARLVTVETARRHEALPVARLDDRTVLVAVADPAGGPGAAAVAAATGLRAVPAVAPRGRLRALIEASASRAEVAPPAASQPVAALADTAAEEPPPAAEPWRDEHGHAAHDRIAELEHQLGEAHAHVVAAEEQRQGADERAAEADQRAAAAGRRVDELESELRRAEATLDAVREAVRLAS